MNKKAFHVLSFSIFALFAQSSHGATIVAADWISGGDGSDFVGTVDGIGVTVSVGGGALTDEGTFDGTSTSFSGADYSPALATTDQVDVEWGGIGSTLTIIFDEPVTNLSIYGAGIQAIEVGATDIFSFSETPTLVSGSSSATIIGNNLVQIGGGNFTQLGGLYSFAGEVTSLTITRLNTPGGVDGTRWQLTASAVPEPSSFLLLGLASVGLFVRRRKNSRQ